MRWAPVAAFGVLLLSLARHAGAGIGDPDTLWHVLAGTHLARTWEFTGPDPLSDFTTRPWVLHQWLPELFLGGAAHLGGLGAVAWAAHIARLAVALAIYRLCRLTAGVLPACLVAAATLLAAADSLSPRPQLVGFALLAVTLHAWLRTSKDLRCRWWLVPLSWLWASSHGTWVVGILVGLVVTAGLVLDRRIGVRAATSLLGISTSCLLVAALTPVGPGLFATFSAINSVSPYISEWQAPSIRDLSTATALFLGLLTTTVWARRRTPLDWTSLGLFACGFVWALMYARTVAVGAIILAPLAAGALGTLVAQRQRPVDRTERAAILVGAAVSAALGALLAAAGPAQPVDSPTGLSTQLDALPAGSVVYNTDTVGGWLMWTHPELRHTYDTRVELYGAAAARDQLDTVSARPGWQARFDRYSPSAALIPRNSALAAGLAERGWRPVGKDGTWVLLEPDQERP